MAVHHGKDGIVKIGSNVVAEIQNWTLNESVETADTTSMGAAAATHLSGVPGFSGSVNCLWDETNTTGQGAMTIGASVVLNLYPEGDSATDTFQSGTVTITGIEKSVPKDGIVTANFTFLGNGALTETTV